MRKRWGWFLICCFVVSVSLLATKLGSQIVTIMVENEPIEREHCVIIDPGHGGEDGGTVSVSNLPESIYNLSISKRLHDLIRLLGYQVKMIRTEDISVCTSGETVAQRKIADLKERVRMVNETKGAILLSIHQNHFTDPQYDGAQVFYAVTEGSMNFAEQLQGLLITTLNPGSRREIKKADSIYIMSHIKCPGVLVECGFLSNPQEEQKLRDPEYQKKLSMVIAAATCRYLSKT